MFLTNTFPRLGSNRSRFARLNRVMLAAVSAIGVVAIGGCESPQSRVYRYDAKVTEVARPAEAQQAYDTAMDQIFAHDLDTAQANLETATRFDPGHGRALNNLGWVYYKNGQLYRAAWAFRGAMRAMPDHPKPLSNLGLTMAAAGRWDDAVSLQQRALELEPGNPKFQARLALAQVKRGDAMVQLRELLETVAATINREDWSRWANEKLVQIDW